MVSSIFFPYDVLLMTARVRWSFCFLIRYSRCFCNQKTDLVRRTEYFKFLFGTRGVFLLSVSVLVFILYVFVNISNISCGIIYYLCSLFDSAETLRGWSFDSSKHAIWSVNGTSTTLSDLITLIYYIILFDRLCHIAFLFSYRNKNI
jgi:hypothetical protein